MGALAVGCGGGEPSHLELYAQRLVVQVPAGIGVAPPLRRQGSYVLSGPCLYPLRSLEPTGLILIDRGAELRLGPLFALWSQPLGRTKLAGFSGRVAAYLNGRRWTGARRRFHSPAARRLRSRPVVW